MASSSAPSYISFGSGLGRNTANPFELLGADVPALQTEKEAEQIPETAEEPEQPKNADFEDIAVDKEGRQVKSAQALQRDFQKRIKANVIPAQERFKERAPIYDFLRREGDQISARYEEGDRPSKKQLEFSPGPGTKRDISAKTPCIVTIRNEDGSLSTYGSIKNEPWLWLSWGLNSQHPVLRITVREPEEKTDASKEGVKAEKKKGREFVVNVFCGSLYREERALDEKKPETLSQCVSFALDWGDSKRLKATIPKDATKELTDMVKNHELVGVIYKTWNGNFPIRQAGPDPCFPQVTGIMPDEAEALRSSWSSLKQPWQCVLGALAGGAEDVQVYRRWFPSGMACASNLNGFLSNAIWMEANFGTHWFYAEQARALGSSIYSEDFDLKQLEAPRWMANDFIGQFDSSGKFSHIVEPHTFGSFPTSASELVYANPRDMAFELCLGIERNRAYQSRVLASAFTEDSFGIAGTFKKLPGETTIYLVEMRVREGKLLNSDKSLRPRVDTKITLSVKSRTYNEDQSAYKLKGQVCDDHFDSGAEVCAVVMGEDLGKSLGIQIPTTGVELGVKATLEDDPTPSDRHKAAIETLVDQFLAFSMDEAYCKKRGVDLPHVILRAPPTIKVTHSLRHDIDKFQQQVLQAVGMLVKESNLNQQQAQAVQFSLWSLCGLLVVQGPPGTGKSWTAAVILAAHIIVGYICESRRPTIACAPSNLATDELMDKLLQLLPLIERILGRKIIVIRYKGAFLQPQKTPAKKDAQGDVAMDTDDASASEEPKLSEEERQMQSAIWEAVAEGSSFGGNEAHTDYGFHVQLMNRVKGWASTRNTPAAHQMSKRATEYYEVVEKLRTAKTKNERALAREDRYYAEQDLMKFYLERDVDVVFSTNSASAHGTLRKYYPPRVLVSDEAAVTTLPDAATPMGIYSYSLEHVVVCGDHEQLRPVVPSKGRNEYSQNLEISLFEQLLNLPYENFKVSLREQYRMHPQLSAMISKIWYKSIGGLIDNATTSQPSELWNTLADLLSKKLGPAHNGRRRTVFDVSGEVIAVRDPATGLADRELAQSFQPSNTSYENRAEARFVVAFILAACRHTPPEGGRQITVDDFLVLCPYTAQCHLINTLLYKRGVNHEGQLVEVASTRAVQGKEGEIVILSMVRNDPQKALNLGFVPESHQLNVAFSRPKQAMICFGNFVAWMNQAINGHILFKPDGKLKHFGHVLRDIDEFHDLVAHADLESWIHLGQVPSGRTIDALVKRIEPSEFQPAPRPIQGGIKRPQDDSRLGKLEQKARDAKKANEPPRPLAHGTPAPGASGSSLPAGPPSLPAKPPLTFGMGNYGGGYTGESSTGGGSVLLPPGGLSSTSAAPATEKDEDEVMGDGGEEPGQAPDPKKRRARHSQRKRGGTNSRRGRGGLGGAAADEGW